MHRAVAKAGVSLGEIDYVNAHGTGTRDNDKAETSAIRELFKPEGRLPPVSSTKSQIGHTLGAAGILEFIVSILATRENQLPPTVNFESARPGCDLDYVPNQTRPASIRAFLSNSAAFGGINVSVVGASSDVKPKVSERATEELWITGIGVVSPSVVVSKTFVTHYNKGAAVSLPLQASKPMIADRIMPHSSPNSILGN